MAFIRATFRLRRNLRMCGDCTRMLVRCHSMGAAEPLFSHRQRIGVELRRLRFSGHETYRKLLVVMEGMFTTHNHIIISLRKSLFWKTWPLSDSVLLTLLLKLQTFFWGKVALVLMLCCYRMCAGATSGGGNDFRGVAVCITGLTQSILNKNVGVIIIFAI